MKVLCIPAFKRAEKGTSGHYKKSAARMLCSDIFFIESILSEYRLVHKRADRCEAEVKGTNIFSVFKESVLNDRQGHLFYFKGKHVTK